MFASSNSGQIPQGPTGPGATDLQGILGMKQVVMSSLITVTSQSPGVLSFSFGTLSTGAKAPPEQQNLIVPFQLVLLPAGGAAPCYNHTTLDARQPQVGGVSLVWSQVHVEVNLLNLKLTRLGLTSKHKGSDRT